MTGARLLTRYSGEAANKERDKEFENMKILVTGAKGFVGKNLCAALKNIKDGKDRRFPDLTIEAVFEYDLDSTPEELDAFP